jgi:hypothetical protein
MMDTVQDWWDYYFEDEDIKTQTEQDWDDWWDYYFEDEDIKTQNE